MDLSPITDPLWKRFYQRQFGQDHTNAVSARLKQCRDKHFTWKDLFKVNMQFFLCFFVQKLYMVIIEFRRKIYLKLNRV
jgi:hypothetical protein